MKASYAVVWSNGSDIDSGRLEPGPDCFRLVGRDHELSIALADVAELSILRRGPERLRGLPVLVLRRRDGGEVKIASLEGAGLLHELMQHALDTGVTAAA
jgi:hypothetical protein